MHYSTALHASTSPQVEIFLIFVFRINFPLVKFSFALCGLCCFSVRTSNTFFHVEVMANVTSSRIMRPKTKQLLAVLMALLVALLFMLHVVFPASPISCFSAFQMGDDDIASRRVNFLLFHLVFIFSKRMEQKQKK